MPQEVGGNQRYSRVFYMAPSLIRGGYLLVNYRWSIFHFGNPTMAQWVNRLRNNIFVNPPQLPLSCEISGALHLAQPGLTAGWLAGRKAG